MKGTIAEALSGEAKAKLIMPNVNKGDIFKMRLTPQEGITPKKEADVDRDKYFIVLGKTLSDSLIGFVVINTHINSGIPQELQDLHYPITAIKYPFLKKTRFVCCAELKEITSDSFVNRYEGDGRCGTLSEDDLELIIGVLKESPLVTNKVLRKFGLEE